MGFLAKFKAAFKKLFGQTSTWIHTGQTVVAFAAPIVVRLLAQFDPAAAAVASPIVSEVMADLSTASVLIGDGKATVSLTSALTRVQDNLNALLDDGHIKNPGTRADVALVLDELSALVAELPTSNSGPALAPVASVAPVAS